MEKSGIFERILLINIVLILSFGGLFFITETSWPRNGVIEHDNHRYIIREMDALEGRGRITGRAKHAPDFIVTFLTSMIQPVRIVKSEKLGNGSKIYEVLLEPGKYILTVDAEGYETLDIKDLEVRPGQDLELNLKFSKKQP